MKHHHSEQLARKGFIGLVLLLAVYLCLSLVMLGWNKYHYILAGGKRFATFPDQVNHLGISLVYLGLVILHLVWLLSTNWFPHAATYFKVLKYAGVFLLLALVAYPLGNDIYLYLHFGLMNLHRVDPFLVSPGAFVSPLTPFVDWKQTATYGPVSQLLFSLSAIAISVHAITAVYLFKLICLITHIFNGCLVWRLTPEGMRAKYAIAYLLCPLLLFEQVASAHVDVFISTCILLTASCLYAQRSILAFVTLFAGFLSKTIPLIWMPLLGLFLLRRQQWRSLGWSIVFAFVVTIVLSTTALRSVDAWRSLLNPGVIGQYQSSIHALVRAALETWALFVPDASTASDFKGALDSLTRYTLIGFALFYAFTLWRMVQRTPYTVASLLEDMGWVTLVLMLYATSWVMPWYVSILYAIAAVIPQARLFGLTTLMLGVSSSAMYWLQSDAGLRSLVSVGLPTLALIVGAIVLRDFSSHPNKTSSSRPL